MFSILDYDKNERVPLITISNAFNFLDKQNRKQTTASIEEICSKILKAFNVDERHLEQYIPSLKDGNGKLELRALVQGLCDYYKDSSTHYSKEDIMQLGENFVNEAGYVAFDEMLSYMRRVRMDKGLAKDAYKTGIHEGAGMGQMGPGPTPQNFGPHNPLMPYSQKVLTQTALNRLNPDHRHFRPPHGQE
jgi:hypothetical protein